MTLHLRAAILPLLLLVAACATGGAGKAPSGRAHQADAKLPDASAFSNRTQKALIAEALTHVERGAAAQASGNMDQARGEWSAAAEAHASFADRFSSSEWRIVARQRAGELYLQAGHPDRAAAVAEKILADPAANDVSKAMAGRVAASAAWFAANAEVKAGRAEALKFVNAVDGAAEAPKPRDPPPAWKRFLDAADAYLARADADPTSAGPAAERRGGPSAAQLALVAAEVDYAFGRMPDAQRRLAGILQRWPADGDVLGSAVPLYLQTFLHLGDRSGWEAQLDRLTELLAGAATKATDAEAKVGFGRALDAVGAGRSRIARKLLEGGKPADAAQVFEAVAAQPAGDVVGALNNAAIAWDAADAPEKAAAIRARIVAEHANAKVAPANALLLAAYHSRKGDHAEAAKLYATFLEKWPDAPTRCVALRNAASAFDLADRVADAAQRYLEFGKDEACAKADPNTTARALFRSGELFKHAGKAAEAKGAFTAAAAVQGVTDPEAKKQVREAKQRAKGL